MNRFGHCDFGECDKMIVCQMCGSQICSVETHNKKRVCVARKIFVSDKPEERHALILSAYCKGCEGVVWTGRAGEIG